MTTSKSNFSRKRATDSFVISSCPCTIKTLLPKDLTVVEVPCGILTLTESGVGSGVGE